MESQKPMAPKPSAAPATQVAAKIKKEEKISNIRGIKNAFIVILCCCAAAICIFLFLMGAPGNFEGGTTDGHPLNLAGTVYKGGFIVPILMTLLLTVIVLSIERWIALSSATAKATLPSLSLTSRLTSQPTTSTQPCSVAKRRKVL